MVSVSDTTRSTLDEVHEAVLGTLDDALEAIGTGSDHLVGRVMDSKRDFHKLERQATDHLAKRLASEGPRRAETYAVEIELVESFRRIHRSCRRIARAAGASLVE